MHLSSPDAAAFTDGFALCAALIVSIGAQNVFVLRQGLRREHVGPVVLLCTGADVMLMSIGVAGLGGILAALPHLTLALTLGGSGFLFWYGWGALSRTLAPNRLQAETTEAPSRLRTTLVRAAGFTFLNPHVYLDTMLLIGTLGATHPGETRAFFVLGASLASVSWFVALGFGASVLRPIFARPGAWRALDGAVAATMVALATGLLWRALGESG